MKTTIFITLLSTLITFASYSQSIFLDPGVNGGSVGFGFGIMEDESFYSVGGSYTLKGKTDFLLSYEQISLGTDLSLNSIILGVEHLLLKQKSGTPINLHLSGNYLFGSVGGDGLSDLGVDLSSSGYEVGAGISYAIGTTFRIVP